MKERNLYLTNTPVDEAQQTYRAVLQSYIDGFGEKQSETLPVIESLGRVTAEPVMAVCSSPLCDSAAMDGIAVRAADTAGASETAPLILKPDRFAVVDTGDPIRPPLDAVVMAEDLALTDDGGVELRAAASPWQHVRPVGEDIVQGEMILPGRHEIRPMDIGVLLSGGMTEVRVRRQPLTAIIPTGTEIIEPGTVPGPGEIIESNSRMLQGLVLEDGGVPQRMEAVPDDRKAIRQALETAVSAGDVVLILSGSSAGTEDYTVHILRELGEVLVHGVAMKPGKPVILAVVAGKPVVGIPGYPVSAWLAYENFVRPLMRAMSGRQRQRTATVQAVITRRLVSSLKHREYVRVKVGQVNGKLVATPLARGAGAAMSLVRADGFCIIEQDQEGVEAGSDVSVSLLRPQETLEQTIVSIGSHDLILDILDDLLSATADRVRLSSTHVGSLAGLMALKRGEAHMAPVHILDEESGVYNLPILRSLFPQQEMALIKGAGRTQGIMVKPGNPLQIQTVADLSRGRFVNRQRGAGTRILLDWLLKKEGLAPEQIDGYEREAATHMAVAAAVAGDSADAGMGVFSAARAMGLDFVPLTDEEYDFAVPAAALQTPEISRLVRALQSEAFRSRTAALGGYQTANSGTIIKTGE